MGRIEIGQRLNPGDEVTSDSGEYQFVLQNDSNLVLYRRNNDGAEAIWSTNTYSDGEATNKSFILQEDYNLVLYSADGQALWQSGTGGADAESAYLSVQDDGNVVLYNQNDEAIWATGTS